MTHRIEIVLAFSDRFAAVLAAVETPAAVVDLGRLERNIARIAALAADHNVRLRPHAKTHKSVALARRQLSRGAAGITVSKASEAEVFIAAGIPSVTVAYPLVVSQKIDRVVRAARQHGAQVRFIADSEIGVAAIAAVAAAHGDRLPVLLKVDVGLHRCGVDPASPRALETGRRLARTPGIAFAGLLSHAGHAYLAADPAAVRAVAAAERAIMTGLAGRLRAEGIEVPEVSVGSTPTTLLHDGFEGITEIRPGNYVFMDRTQVALGVAAPEDVALWVATTVVSANDRYAIVDAGSKVLSSDRGPHGSTSVAGYGLAWRCDAPDAPPLPLVALSEEHGFVEHGGRPPAVGTRMVILPNHSCTVVNLAEELIVAAEDGTTQRWPVDARARVR